MQGRDTLGQLHRKPHCLKSQLGQSIVFRRYASRSRNPEESVVGLMIVHINRQIYDLHLAQVHYRNQMALGNDLA